MQSVAASCVELLFGAVKCRSSISLSDCSKFQEGCHLLNPSELFPKLISSLQFVSSSQSFPFSSSFNSKSFRKSLTSGEVLHTGTFMLGCSCPFPVAVVCIGDSL